MRQVRQKVAMLKLGDIFAHETHLPRPTQGRFQAVTEHGCCRKNNNVPAQKKTSNPATPCEESAAESRLDRRPSAMELSVIPPQAHLLLPLRFPKFEGT